MAISWDRGGPPLWHVLCRKSGPGPLQAGDSRGQRPGSGIDAAAHRGSLRGGGPTLAILGCGLGVHYPREHRRLRQEIEACGAVVSEYPLEHTGPDPGDSRLGTGSWQPWPTSSWSSGSLPEWSPDHGRPGQRNRARRHGCPRGPSVGPSEGCLQLLADGAAVARSAEDVLDALGIHLSPAPKRTDLPDGTSGEVLAALGCEGARVDTLVDRTGRAPGLVAATLVRLEVEGRVRRLPEGIWVKL